MPKFATAVRLLRTEGPRYVFSLAILKLRDALFPWVPLPMAHPDGGRLLYFLNDHVCRDLWMGSDIDRLERSFLRGYLKPGMIFFDLGANCGLYTILASLRVGPTGQVHAFEPAPSEMRKLRTNVARNVLTNVHCRPLAISNQRGRATFFNCGGDRGSFSSFQRPDATTPVQQVEVDTMTLDDYVVENRVGKIDVMKIDVEGAERRVFEGATRVFTETGLRPLVLCEFADRRTIPFGYKAVELKRYLEKFRYTWFELSDSGLKQAADKDVYGYENLLAVPTEKLPEVLPQT